MLTENNGYFIVQLNLLIRYFYYLTENLKNNKNLINLDTEKYQILL